MYYSEVRSFELVHVDWYISPLGICLGALGSVLESNPQPYGYYLFISVGEE